MGAERWDEQVGSVADEAGRLLESLRRSAAEPAAHQSEGDHGRDAGGSAPAPGSPGAEAPSGGMPGADTAAAAGAASGPDGAAHDPFCTWCPLCRGAAVVRSLSPETLAKLADLASLAATVLTDLASSRPAGGPPASTDGPDGPDGPDGASGTGGSPTPSGTRPRPATRAGRTTPAPSRQIPVSDADDPQEAPRG